MKLQTLIAVTVFAAALPAPAAPTCNAGQVVAGNNCTFSPVLGWAVAGQGTASILTFYVPPNASGPVDFEVTGLSSSLGSAYTGYFGIEGGELGTSKSNIVALKDIVAGAPDSIGPVPPGELGQILITNVCWDPTCTSAAPAGAVPNMFSMEFTMSSPNAADLSATPAPRLAIQFLNGSQVTWQETETALRSDSQYDIIPGISLGATPQGRYVFNNGAVTQPFDAISVSNLDNPNAIGGTVFIKDMNGNIVATTSLPSIPPGGAAGYLLIGRTPGDPLGLFPSNTTLPAGSDGLFHGTLELHTTGLTVNGLCIVLAQEYNGNSMVNLPVYHSPVP